ncbi:MAG: hypothetical protein A4E66_02482 [Syntrophus sp. PtaB.Bin001]|nr:MAG: hypothetical protein A4E66_02482 [Syntrophus sp. PtaB.Bin001]
MAKKSFEDALKTFKDSICDLTSIEVQTYTGNLTVEVDDQGNVPDFQKILSKAKTTGNLKLAYVTKINLDGDGIVLVPETAAPDHIQQAHNAAIKAGQEVRQAILTLFADMTGLAIKK